MAFSMRFRDDLGALVPLAGFSVFLDLLDLNTGGLIQTLTSPFTVAGDAILASFSVADIASITVSRAHHRLRVLNGGSGYYFQGRAEVVV